MFTRSTDAFLRYDFFFKRSKNYEKQTEALKIIHGFSRDVARQKRAKMETMETDEQTGTFDSDDVGLRKREVFIDILLKSTIDGKPLTDSEICEEIDNLMFAVINV